MDKHLHYRPARIADARLLAADMRAADVAELVAMHGTWTDVEALLVDAIQQSSPTCWSAFLGDELLMVGGAAPGAPSLLGDGRLGVPWMLATNRMVGRGGALTAAALRYLADIRQRYTCLHNYVDARHTASIRWLKRLGFTVSDKPMPAGPYGMPFHSFWKEA